MKKFFAALLAMLVLLICFSTVASAATKEDIVQALKDSKLKEVYVLQAESYLNEIDVTSEQAEAILQRIKNVNEIVGKETTLSKLTGEQKQKVLFEFTEAGKVLDLTVVYDAGTILITDSEDKSVYMTQDADAVKQTGIDYTVILYGLGFILLAAGSTAVSKKFIKAHR